MNPISGHYSLLGCGTNSPIWSLLLEHISSSLGFCSHRLLFPPSLPTQSQSSFLTPTSAQPSNITDLPTSNTDLSPYLHTMLVILSRLKILRTNGSFSLSQIYIHSLPREHLFTQDQHLNLPTRKLPGPLTDSSPKLQSF